MDSSKELFHTRYGKRLVLVADDEMINRELLREILEDRYDLLFAADGEQALELIEENTNVLSLVLLDLLMPKVSGTEVLTALRADSRFHHLPVIVLTSDHKSEVECLNLGASDFISKPYPEPDIIHARIQRTIELYEDRRIISSTERDQLTGLYTRDYFFRYAEDFDIHHHNLEMDAIVVDIVHFRMINERFGTRAGDRLLQKIGGRLRELIDDHTGFVCRREADVFLIYCPHGLNYSEFLEQALIFDREGIPDMKVRLRMGVYALVDKKLDLARRFDRAQIAADIVSTSVTKTIGFYDNAMHEKELYDEQLVENFDAAIREEQFEVYYQPKFDIRREVPFLSSAEALVRWFHPELGMIPPNRFIPLFEENGLIQTLDHYIWRKAAAKIRDWKERLGFSVPVSVNVSRIDMYDPELVETLTEIIRESGISTDELYLEITESAYTKDSDQMIEMVNRLRKLGFRIEMDDFGTGYSSLNMISELPIDALKLDMQFIRNAFREHRDTWMLEVIIDIAGYMHVPTIAEGVETEEQMISLKELGCDLVQGYYFSKPVPAAQFEPFLLERKKQAEQEGYGELSLWNYELQYLTDGRQADGPADEVQRKLFETCVDPLTGLLNEKAFFLKLNSTDLSQAALLAVEIDGLKEIREKEGKESAEAVILRVAELLRGNFRSSDGVFRMEDDSFSVIMTRANSSLSHMVLHKTMYLNYLLKHPSDDARPLTLSIGTAFGDRRSASDSLYECARAALEIVKEKGGSGCEIY